MLFEVAPGVKQDQCIKITHVMVLTYSITHDALNLNTFSERQRLVDWFISIGKSSFALDRLNELVFQNLNQGEQLETSKKEFGVNIIGYTRSLSGLGEDLRSIVAMVDNLGIPYCTLSCRHISDSADFAVVKNEAFYPKYAVSIFCMNHIEFGKLTTIYDNLDMFGYCILQAPWELPILPADLIPPLHNVNEHWAISKFVETALLNAGMNNVHHIHPVVRHKEAKLNSALRLKMPTQRRKFTFLFIFDSSSFLSRKNPLALIHAFQMAFSEDQHVQLILKISNAVDNPSYISMKRAAYSDARILIITEQYTNQQLSQLYQRSDCYVSLHRSEGFGRTIAEAALHKMPIIVTAWSGSCDIFPEDYELFVSYSLQDLEEGEYPFSENQYWAEPNLEHAANLMLRVFNMDESECQELGLRNFEFVSKNFTGETTLLQIEPRLSVALKQKIQ